MKKCLIVIDYQKDFVDGALGFPKARELEDGIAKKIRLYRENGDDVLFTLDTHDGGYLDTQEGKNLPIPHCIKGTPGHELYGKAAGLRQEGDRCFCKGAFGSGELFLYLREHPYESIELVGVVSNICVLSNAVLAKTALPEVPVLVDAKCTAAPDEETHKKALDILEGIQVQVTGRG